MPRVLVGNGVDFKLTIQWGQKKGRCDLGHTETGISIRA